MMDASLSTPNTSGASTTTTTTNQVVGGKQPRNDNSNPQQGTGRGGGSPPSKEFSTTRSNQHHHLHHRPSLKIPPTEKDERKLFVGGLPQDITADEFRTYFEQFGILLDAVVMIEHESGRSRGFGFVSFEDPEVARGLLRMGHDDNASHGEPLVGRMDMRGKTIELKAARPKQSSGSQNRRYHPQRGERRGQNNSPGGTYSKPQAFDAAAFSPQPDPYGGGGYYDPNHSPGNYMGVPAMHAYYPPMMMPPGPGMVAGAAGADPNAYYPDAVSNPQFHPPSVPPLAFYPAYHPHQQVSPAMGMPPQMPIYDPAGGPTVWPSLNEAAADPPQAEAGQDDTPEEPSN